MVNSSVEYYHYCTSSPPLIAAIGVRPPRSDSAIVASVFGTRGYREYFGCWLPQPLVNGQTYCISFWIAISPYSLETVDRYQVLFTPDKPVQNYPPLPSFILDSAQFTYYGYITKTDPWTHISGSFVGDGTERFMTFGVFDPRDSIKPIVNGPGLTDAYYFIDDVALYACNAPVEVADAGPDRHVCLGDSVQVGTHELAEYRYYWYVDSVLVSREARPVFSITQPTTYVLLVKDFKFDESWDTLTLYPVNCDTIPLGCGQREVYVCQGDSALLGCHNRDNYQYGWVHPPDTNTFSTSGQIRIKPDSSTQYILYTKDYTGRESLDTIRLTPVNCAMIRAHAGGHYRLCPGDTIALGASPIPGASYLWFQDLALIDTLPNPRVSPTTNTVYRLEVINPREEVFTDWAYVEIVECDVPLLIPNAFTPNGDGINDYFEIIAPQGTQLDVLIYSRWGNQLFSGNQDQFWDGSYHNVPVPLGTYYYSIKATLPPYRPTIVTGNVIVVK